MASSKHPDSPTKLTEFAPLSSEVKPSGGFFARFFKKDDKQLSGPVPDSHDEPCDVTTETEDSNFPGGGILGDNQVPKPEPEENGSVEEGLRDTVKPPGCESPSTQRRNLTSVLKRLSNILDRRSQTPQAYKDSDFKQYWMPDSNCKECYECGDKFNTFRRRHHCRICGQIFCSRCCNQEVPGKIMGYTGYLRVCTYCCKVVLSYAQNPEASCDLRTMSEDLKKQLTLGLDSESLLDAESSWRVSTLKRKALKQLLGTSIFDEDVYKQRPSSGVDMTSPPSTMFPFDVTSHSEFCTFQEERRLLIQDSSQLREIWQLLQHPVDGIEMQNHRHRLRTYPSCLVGSELADWLIARDKASTREQAVAIGQALVDAKWLECVTSNDHVFRDEYALYKPGQTALKDPQEEMVVSPDTPSIEDDDSEAPQWFKEIKIQDNDNESVSELDKIPSTVSAPDKQGAQATSVFYIDQANQNDLRRITKKLKASYSSSSGSGTDRSKDDCSKYAPLTLASHDAWTVPLIGCRDYADGKKRKYSDTGIYGIKGAFTAANEDVPMDMETPGGWEEADEVREESIERQAFDRLSKSQQEHMTCVVKQLLGRDGLSLKWADTILTLVRRISQIVRPDIRDEGDDMDIRQYVQIKKVPGGSRNQTGLVCGVVCSKTVAHKKMRQQILNPKILLLSAPIEYQRVEQKFSSLEPQILQEHEFLKNCVARISELQPDILLVGKTVSRVAQDFLLDTGLTLVVNVKPSVMERVSRFTQANIATSIDALVTKTAMGACHVFKLHSFSLPDGRSKTLMYFEGCPTHLGCTVTLRGAGLTELKKVKRILMFMVYAAYHSKLEMAFLMDEFAMPLTPPDEIGLEVGGSEANSPTVAARAEAGRCWEKPTETKDQFLASNVDDTSLFEKARTNENNDKNNPNKSAPPVKLEKDTSPKPLEQKGCSQMSNVGEVTSLNSQEQSHATSESVVNNGQIESKALGKSNKDISKTAIMDKSDPLHNYQVSKDESIFHSDGSLQVDPEVFGKKFKKALDDVILNISPYVKYDIPYLETEQGSQCAFRKYFPDEVFWSEHFSSGGEKRKTRTWEVDDGVVDDSPAVSVLPPHPFVTTKLTSPLGDSETQALLADFRARGGRMQLPPHDHHIQHETSNNQTKSDKESCEESSSKVDCLNIYKHQHLAVLLSSFSCVSANAPNPCVYPWVVTMDFYGRNDVTLGGFLERYCFRENYRCPSDTCETPMVDHIRRFVHDNGIVQVILKKLEHTIPSYQDNILMWGWCRKCRQVTPVVNMSMDTWSMSFAKYLEMRFHGSAYSRRAGDDMCTHSLHQDHFQYFGYKQIIAAFKYSCIGLNEIALPPMVISIVDQDFSLLPFEDECKTLRYRGMNTWSALLDQLLGLQREAGSESQQSLVSDYMTQLQTEKEQFRQSIDQLQSLLQESTANITREDRLVSGASLRFRMEDKLVGIKRQIADVVVSWNNRILEFEQQQKKPERVKLGNASFMERSKSGKDLTSASESFSSLPSGESPAPPRWLIHEEDDIGFNQTEPTFIVGGDNDRSSQGQESRGRRASRDDHSPSRVPVCEQSRQTSQDGTSPASLARYAAVNDNTSPMFGDEVVKPGHFGSPVLKGGALDEEGLNSSLVPPGSVSSDGSKASLKSDRAFEKTCSSDDLDGASKIEVDEELKGHSRSRSLGEPKKIFKQSPNLFDEVDKLEKRASMKTILSSFLSSSGSALVQIPFPASEHQLLPPGEKVPLVVYDQEPSSIIAYTLGSLEYEKQLQELQSLLVKEGHSPSPVHRKEGKTKDTVPFGNIDTVDSYYDVGKKGSSSVLSFFRGAGRERGPSREDNRYDVDTSVKYTPQLDRDSVEESGDDPDYGMMAPDAERNKSAKQQMINHHIELQFSDNTTKFYCRVYYADQFGKLRKLIFPEGEERYIRSLSRCFTWLARGGKSGSAFCKTQDDRFILKQMSRYEVQSFVEFAPHYFQYVTKAYTEQKPTVLAKILGVYRIGYRNSQSNAALKQDLLVMENLFYDKNISQIFDLKGSMRNRLVNTSGKQVEDLVLLDENLLKLSTESPLYVRPHTKAVLSVAIANDTHFLSSHLVMDYSLLVGLDDAKKELVVGIIDYIRTFTWDKKLEMVVKTTWGQGKMPTVVSPELYRSRFLEAMERYFLLVPDRWYGLGQNPKCAFRWH